MRKQKRQEKHPLRLHFCTYWSTETRSPTANCRICLNLCSFPFFFLPQPPNPRRQRKLKQMVTHTPNPPETMQMQKDRFAWIRVHGMDAGRRNRTVADQHPLYPCATLFVSP